jgi:polysaccharide biosynthesis/export protein
VPPESPTGTVTLGGVLQGGNLVQAPTPGAGSLLLSGTNTYSGGTTVNGGMLQLGNAPNAWNGTFSLGTGGTYTGPAKQQYDVFVDLGTGPTATLTLGGYNTAPAMTAPNGPVTPIPAGPVFYIVVEGAGMGDSVRSVPWTGKETVLAAVSAVNGFSQVSSAKIWIARPSPDKQDKGTILPIDWEAISKRGINTTNYTLQPNDRLVFGQDPLVTRSNLLSKKTAPIDRINGVVGLTTNTVSGLHDAPAAGKVVKELLDKGFITDDPELKRIVLDALGGKEKDADTKKADGKSAEAKRPVQLEIGSLSGTIEILGFSGTNSGTGVLRIEAAEPKPAQGKIVANLVPATAPHELAMQPLPAYRIESPDVIAIDMLKLVPKQPSRAGIYDVFYIHANGLPGHPIDAQYMIANDGKVNLGPVYGKVKVVGLTEDEMKMELNKSLRQWLADPDVNLQLQRVAGSQPVTGQYLVGPDGTINLRHYGQILLAGKTVTEARVAIQNHLKQFLDSPEISVDVVSYNSKVFYIVTQGAGIGDSVRRLPSTGHECVLDAMAQVGGLTQVSSKNIWIARPSAASPDKPTILHVDWDAITRGETSTNYQIFPGDRIYVAEDPEITRTNLIGKKTAPIERITGIIGLTTNTISGLNSTPGAAPVIKALVEKGLITEDEEVKKILLDAIRLSEEESKKAPPKEPAKP